MKYLSDSLRGKREDDKTYIRKNGRKAQTQKGSLKMEKRRMAWEKVGLIKERRSDRLKKMWKEKLAVLWEKGKERRNMKQNYIMGKIWRKYVALYTGQCQSVHEIRTTSVHSGVHNY